MSNSDVQAQQLLSATRQQTVAILAAAIVTAANRPHSIQEVLDLQRDIHFAMFPSSGSGAYQEWAKTKDERLKLPRS
jgi:hypothetical protein